MPIQRKEFMSSTGTCSKVHGQGVNRFYGKSKDDVLLISQVVKLLSLLSSYL